MRMAVPGGSVTGPSPATQLPARVPSASVKLADVISGSPGSNDHPAIQIVRRVRVASAAPAGTLTARAPTFRLKAEATRVDWEEATRVDWAEATRVDWAEATRVDCAEATRVDGAEAAGV